MMMITFIVPEENGKKVLTMPDCKWMQDEICVNADCPKCSDYCPVHETEEVCRFEDRGVDNG